VDFRQTMVGHFLPMRRFSNSPEVKWSENQNVINRVHQFSPIWRKAFFGKRLRFSGLREKRVQTPPWKWGYRWLPGT
jgi:hypothetical protein